MLKDTELVELAERNDYKMSSVVKITIDMATIGGADHRGAVEKVKIDDQFVIEGSSYHNLGRCLGVHFGLMVEKLVTNLQDYKEFKDAIVENFEDRVDALRDELDTLDRQDTAE